MTEQSTGISIPSRDSYDFYDHFVQQIPGWLEKGAAIRTMDMLSFQEESDIKGSFLEIGIYCGKYLSILMRQAAFSKSVVLGIDTFQLTSIESVVEHLKPIVARTHAQARLMKAFSTDCDVPSVLGHLTQRPRFISIDGSHERHDVHWDLELSEQLLTAGGIIAVDDFINPLAFGVNEAAHIFFSRPRRVVPFAYIENKLFLSDRNWAPRFRASLETTVMQDQIEPHSRRFRELLAQSRGLVEQELWDSTVLLLPQ